MEVVVNPIDTQNIGEVISWLAIAVFILSTVIQISPIEVNPWSWLAKQIGKELLKDVMNEVRKIKEDVENVKIDICGVGSEICAVKSCLDEQCAKTARTKIIRFGDEILHDMKHSKEHFDEVLLDITEYNQFCKDHPEFKNQMTETTTKIILLQYEKCMKDHTFL